MRENWLNEDNLMRDEAFLTQLTDPRAT